MTILQKLAGGLIVSCQALEHEPLHGPWFMAGMARAAKQGGAVGIRANGVEDIRAIKEVTGLPIIGIEKQEDNSGNLCITPDCAAAERVAGAGADIIAIDCRRNRPFGDELSLLVPAVKQKLGVPVMADVGTVDEALAAQQLGVDLVAPTFGFQEGTYGSEPDFPLLEELIGTLSVPVIAEGGYWSPEQVLRALELGALAVVVGTAITRPQEITRRFVRAITAKQK